MRTATLADELVKAAKALGAAADQLKFKPPVTHVYNPLNYAWAAHEAYLRKFGDSRKRVVFLGMNPGPFGMAQTGVPFGEVAAVRDWMRIEAPVGQPQREHPRRPVAGFACQRSEVSGRRLWGFFAESFGRPEAFFARHFVVNYCPLAFFDATGRNLTPDKLRGAQALALHRVCDRHLCRVVEILEPQWIIGVGRFATQQANRLFGEPPPRVGGMLHPSPANPQANQDWSRKVLRQLKSLGIGTD